jgi:DNA-binding response OmpR family regulator
MKRRKTMAAVKVLLVDDEEELVKALVERLEIRGITADVALNGEQGLQRVKYNTPDVMVLDLRMPGIDGLEVLRRVRKSHPQIRVIILTGHGSERDREVAERIGAFDYLQKPVDIQVLVEVLNRAWKSRLENGASLETAE